MVSFSDAVKICLIKKYATMSGRASRSEFWWFQLFIWVTDICIMALSSPFGKDSEGFFIGVFVIFTLLTLIPYFCVFVRRLHDGGHSGSIFWWSFLISIYGVLLIGLIMNMFGSDEGTNEYGPNPNDPIGPDNISIEKESLSEVETASVADENTEITDVDL